MVQSRNTEIWKSYNLARNRFIINLPADEQDPRSSEAKIQDYAQNK